MKSNPLDNIYGSAENDRQIKKRLKKMTKTQLRAKFLGNGKLVILDKKGKPKYEQG